MNNPKIIMAIIAVIVVVAIVSQGKGGPQVLQSGGASDLKARAEAQAITDSSLNAARKNIIDALMVQQKQQFDFTTGLTKIRADTVMFSEASKTEREKIASGERIAFRSVEGQEKSAAMNADAAKYAADQKASTEQQGQGMNFFTGILKIVGTVFGFLL